MRLAGLVARQCDVGHRAAKWLARAARQYIAARHFSFIFFQYTADLKFNRQKVITRNRMSNTDRLNTRSAHER